MKNLTYRLMVAGEEETVINIVTEVFNEFVAPQYSEEGVTEFYKYANATNLAERSKVNHFTVIAELNNAPSYEKQYRNSQTPRSHYVEAIKADCPPSQREYLIKSAFTELRTCYEVLVINDLFKNVVQRFTERVSVDCLKDVCFDDVLVDELLDNFGQCCRYMEGHTHSDKYAYQKPTVENLNTEINRYDDIRAKIKKSKKQI